jgi:hypothetical protein
MSRNGYHPKFETTVAKMSGALLEISNEGTVRFIHLSVLGFLTGAMESPTGIHGAEPPPLVIVPQTLHCSLSTECISYLLHSLADRYIGGSYRLKLDSMELLRKHPMSLYATQFWASHAYEALASTHTALNSTGLPVQALVDRVTNFISNKRAITAWTEACWTLGSPPNQGGLSDEAGELISLFSRDLGRMNQQWGSVLQDAPHQLWEPSIPAFM